MEGEIPFELEQSGEDSVLSRPGMAVNDGQDLE